MTTPQPPPGYYPVTSGVTQEGDLFNTGGPDWYPVSPGALRAECYWAVARPIRREAKPHNPAGLTPEQVGVLGGWRLLDEDEVGLKSWPDLDAIQMWQDIPSDRSKHKWMDMKCRGSDAECTYRTRLSRAELRAARGLPEEPTCKPDLQVACICGDKSTERGHMSECPAGQRDWMREDVGTLVAEIRRLEGQIVLIKTERDKFFSDCMAQIKGLKKENARRLRESDERNASSLRDVEELSHRLKEETELHLSAYGMQIEETGRVEAERDRLAAEVARLQDYVDRLPANWFEDSSLETWFPFTAQHEKSLKEQIDRLTRERDEALRKTSRRVAMPHGLHSETEDLVLCFAAAMADKLRAAEQKYGYGAAWNRADWEDECAAQLTAHLSKGDPRDVAAYCMFMWSHGWKTRDEQKARANNAVDVMEVAIKKAQEAEARAEKAEAEAERLLGICRTRFQAVTTLREALQNIREHIEGIASGSCITMAPHMAGEAVEIANKALAGTEERQPAPSANLDGFNTPY